jgi:hypothetical protein
VVDDPVKRRGTTLPELEVSIVEPLFQRQRGPRPGPAASGRRRREAEHKCIKRNADMLARLITEMLSAKA